MDSLVQCVKFCNIVRVHIAFHVLIYLLVLGTVSLNDLNSSKLFSDMNRNLSLDILFLPDQDLGFPGVLHCDKSIDWHNGEHNESEFPTHYKQNYNASHNVYHVSNEES